MWVGVIRHEIECTGSTSIFLEKVENNEIELTVEGDTKICSFIDGNIVWSEGDDGYSKILLSKSNLDELIEKLQEMRQHG